jgi:hypothetical protein
MSTYAIIVSTLVKADTCASRSEDLARQIAASVSDRQVYLAREELHHRLPYQHRDQVN